MSRAKSTEKALSLDGLTPQQYCFALEYVRSGNRAIAAYEAAYPRVVTKKNRGQKYFEARKLLSHAGIIAKISEIRNEMLVLSGKTPAQSIEQMSEIRDQAMQAGKFSAAVAAERSIGEMLGFYIERHQITVSDMTETQLIDRLVDLMTADKGVFAIVVDAIKSSPEMLTQVMGSLPLIAVKEQQEVPSAAPPPDTTDDHTTHSLDRRSDPEPTEVPPPLSG